MSQVGQVSALISPEVVLFLVVSVFMLALVPRERYPHLFPSAFVYGLVGPLLGAALLRYLFGVHLSPTRFTIASLDLWLLVAWIPQFVIFYHFLPSRDSWQFWVYVTAFAVLSTCIWRAFAHAGRVAGVNALIVLALTFVGYAVAPFFRRVFEAGRPGPPPDPWMRNG